MNILIYRYGSICEPYIIETFKKLNLNVVEETTEVVHKNLLPSDRIKIVKEALDKHQPMFLFSINFFPVIADVCHIYGVKYVCWTVDCPVMELFSTSIKHDTNRVFMFDRAQYETIHPFNPKGTFYLPLAAATERFDYVISTITKQERKKFSHDISFVGSLYNEKNPMKTMGEISEYMTGYINGVVEASLKVMGYNFIEETVTEEMITALKNAGLPFYNTNYSVINTSKYLTAHSYIGAQVTEIERIRTLNTLAQYFSVDMYTLSDTSDLKNVRINGPAKSLTEMPKIFHLSKINLSMTTKPIQTGLPLRIFDIMGCGGFCMTNFQPELPEYFEIGVDLEAYGSLEELVDKCSYYLTHEDERRQIALNGYRKVKEYHTYINRMAEMVRKVM